MSYYEHISESYARSIGAATATESVLPGLRSDIVVRRLVAKDEINFVVKDPLIQAYYKFSPEEWDIISLFDGTRSAEQIVQEYSLHHPNEYIDEELVLGHRQALKEMDLLNLPAIEKSLQFMERMKEQRKNMAEKSKFKNLFEMTFSAWDPDDAFNKVIPYLRFLYTKEFFVLSFIAIMMMAVVNVIKWEEFKQGTYAMYSFTDKSLWEILVFVFLMTVTGTIHELGHGLTLKHYGGEVRAVGFLLFYLTPAFYCDVSDSYLLQSRKERLWVTFAGTYCELVLCSIATFVWYFAVPGTLIYDLAFQVILFTGISSFLINMNPLVKLDGYYALMDWLELPELREESFEYLSRSIKKIFRVQAEEMPGITRRKKRIYLLYGFTAILYTLMVYVFIVFWLRNIFLESFKTFGYVLLTGTLYFLFRKELRQGFSFFRFVYLDKKEVFMKRLKNVYVGAAMVLLLLLITIPKTHMKVSGSCVVQPIQQTEIRTEVAGFVRAVNVHENQIVSAGQEIALLQNAELSQDEFRSASALASLDRNLQIAQIEGDASTYQTKMRIRQELSIKDSELRRKKRQLTLRTPIGGKIATPRVEENNGKYLERGEVFCKVIATDFVKIEIPVREYYTSDLRKGQKVKLKLDAYPTSTFEGTLERISPAISQRVEALEGTYTEFLAVAIVANPDGRLLAGMRGDAKIFAAEYSIAGRILRELNRWIQSRIW
jgi:putative peptide zinc metalloprotease protein